AGVDDDLQPAVFSLLKALATDTNALVRCEVAENPATPADLVRALATDTDPRVRCEVAENPATPDDVRLDLLHALATDTRDLPPGFGLV
ncbi:MAG: hypothetical protein KGO50_18745, partial [Myxococcales bacterium]|nr:hypothetical protein [Myxococcales bacterium]